MPKILFNSTCALRRVIRKKWHVGTVGRLLMDFCVCISFAMSSGLVRMLLFRSIMQSSGVVSRF